MQREATVTIIGSGYVDLPLALEFMRAGFRIVGKDHPRIDVVQKISCTSFGPRG